LTRYSHGKKKKELKRTRKRRGRGMGGNQKKYDREYKLQAVKLSKEIGGREGGGRVGDSGGHPVWLAESGAGGAAEGEKEFLEETSAFFAASRRKSAKSRE